MKKLLLISAVIFDMDGLMFDTERISLEFWRKSMAKFGYTLDDKLYISNIGKSDKDRYEAFIIHYGRDFPFLEIKELKKRYFEKYINICGIPLMPGLIEILDLLSNLKIEKAIASSSTENVIYEKLENIEIRDYFQAIIGGEEVKNGKPAPDIFIKAAQQLSIEPKYCIVFEDSNVGVMAAHSAGMIPIMIPNLEKPSNDSISMAYKIYSNLIEAKKLFKNVVVNVT